ncbi:MAG: ABC transporter ATP-binding protein [Tissierellales bacterium]|jgi:oligopeptide/dipeptide ABC transporter ATP-binding protein|nr:ABC transporter ATP-binding protein [Tissierellales bacterium]
MEKLLKVRDLKTSFYIDSKLVPVIENINFDLYKGEIVALVGESGSGKSVTSLSVLNAISAEAGLIESGMVEFEGRDVLKLKRKELQKIWGNDISMIFQEPMTALNPVYTIGKQVAEMFRIHERCSKKEARKKALELLQSVGIPSADKRFDQYPHQMSGGIRQRVMIAMAIACRPKLIIADEPTTALDVSMQSQILALMKSINKDYDTTILLITHDLGVVAAIADRVMVMYAGQLVEHNDVDTLFNNPKHPYTKGLISSVSSLDLGEESLAVIEGMVPRASEFKSGCHFYERCPVAMKHCEYEKPETEKFGNGEYKCFCKEHVRGEKLA